MPWRRAVKIARTTAALCLLLAIQLGCASHRGIQRPEPGSSGPGDRQAVIPFSSSAEGGEQVRRAICEALSDRSHSYTVAIQPGAETDERLQNAGWSPGWARETGASANLGRASGAQFVMIGDVSSYGEASFVSFLGALLTLGMVPPGTDKMDLQLDVAFYDCRSRERIWT